jgi:hypothetical protein
MQWTADTAKPFADAKFLEMFYDRCIAQGEEVVKLCQNS